MPSAAGTSLEFFYLSLQTNRCARLYIKTLVWDESLKEKIVKMLKFAIVVAFKVPPRIPGRKTGVVLVWIPAFAGMTVMRAGMTVMKAGMTIRGTGMTA